MSVRIDRVPGADYGAILPDLVVAWDSNAPGMNSFQDPLMGGLPAALLRQAGPRTGVLTMVFDNATDAFRAELAHRGLGTFTYADTALASSNMIYAVDSGGVRLYLDQETQKTWLLEVAFRQVG